MSFNIGQKVKYNQLALTNNLSNVFPHRTEGIISGYTIKPGVYQVIWNDKSRSKTAGRYLERIDK